MPARVPVSKKRPKPLCLKLLITDTIVTHNVTGYKMPNELGNRRAATDGDCRRSPESARPR
jgi:hypothetical protein